MLKAKILSVGKNKETWLDEALSDYTKRLSPYMQIETIWAKNDEHLISLCSVSPVLALDPNGKSYDSVEFSQYVQTQFEKQGSRLTFVIGGAEGLPTIIKHNAMLISLSKLTFTHQIARLVLVEQLNRAMEIVKGTPYHK